MSIVDNRLELIDLIQANLAIVASGDPVEELGTSFETLTECFQALGICNLLLTMQPAGFHRNLFFSGCTRRYFLRRDQDEPRTMIRHRAISRTDAFFDAIAAGAMDVATEIARLSPDNWIPSGEYEDDFCYHAFLHHFVSGLPQPAAARQDELLERFAAALEGASSPRLNVCQALRTRDAETFHAAFADLLDERSAEYAERKQQSAVDMTIEPRYSIFVEGLALLWIAAQIGIPVDSEYPGCPSIAALARGSTREPDIFDDIDQLIRKG